MCFSAQLELDFGAIEQYLGPLKIDWEAFERLYGARAEDAGIKIPRGLDHNFRDPKTPIEVRIKALIDDYQHQRTHQLETALFEQTTRLVEAERSLKLKATKKAQESQRIATHKIATFRSKLSDQRRTESRPSDSRIFPMQYGAVVVEEDGQRQIRPMRYHCRPAGKPETIDQERDGLYNARRDNLDRFWKKQFGHTHALVLVSAFYENVALHDFEHRELAPGEKPKNLVLHFNPPAATMMRVACVWSRWEKPGERALESFAAITDEPPAEVAATGHDRCIVPVKPENIARWLRPQGQTSEQLHQILEDRERPYYEHRRAA